jgi:hypothetical protein
VTHERLWLNSPMEMIATSAADQQLTAPVPSR